MPAVPEERFEQTLDLDWPIDGLEPLSFVLGRLMEPLSAHLERRDRGAAVLHVRLQLVTRVVHERSLQLPAPMRDARALRTLALLDLESHPPAAAIDRVTVAVDPTPGRVVQFSLLTRPLPSPEHVSTLMARLAALMGEGRCGSPELVDSWRPGACAIKPFAPRDSNILHAPSHAPREAAETARRPKTRSPKMIFSVAQWLRGLWQQSVLEETPLSRCADSARPFPCACVWKTAGRCVSGSIDADFGGGQIVMGAGPWRTSGAWWEPQRLGSGGDGTWRLPTA